MDGDTLGQGPLRGLTIVDLSMWWSGPLTTELFALMGARVIKIESVQRVDGWRLAARMSADVGLEGAANFNGVNVNKLGITLDLSDDRGRAILRRLTQDADALVENYSPRVMANLGLTDDVLWSWRPDLVILSMPAFGLTSPWRDYVGFAPTIEQISGLPQLVGYEGSTPSLSGNSLADPVAGYTGALALLTGLHERARTGLGQHIDLSQLEALTGLLGHAIVGSQFAEETLRRVGNTSTTDAPCGCYPALGNDKWLVVSVDSDGAFSSLCEVIGQRALIGDERFESPSRRLANRAALDSLVANWSGGMEAPEAASLLQEKGVTAAPVMGPADLLADPHLADRGFWHVLDRPTVGTHPHPGLPFQFSATPGSLYQAAPTLGRDNHKVLHELLQMDEEAISALEFEHVIGTTALG